MSGRIAIRSVCRFVAICIFLYSYSLRDGDHWPEGMKARNQYGGNFRYLTFCNVMGSILVNGLFIVGECSQKVKSIAKTLAISMSFPISFAVFVLFWSIYLINREFIHPVEVEPFYTQTMSLIDHFMILPVALMNISLDHVTISRRSATWLFYLAFVAYTVFIYHIHSVTGRWVYPFMNHLGFYHVTMYFVPTLCILGIFVVKLSFAINNYFTKPKAKSN